MVVEILGFTVVQMTVPPRTLVLAVVAPRSVGAFGLISTLLGSDLTPRWAIDISVRVCVRDKVRVGSFTLLSALCALL